MNYREVMEIQVDSLPPDLAATPEVKLWRTIILMALNDALYLLSWNYAGECKNANRVITVSPETVIYADAARHFILHDRSCFGRICNAAFLDPDYVRDRSRKAITDFDAKYPFLMKQVKPQAHGNIGRPRGSLNKRRDRLDPSLLAA